MNSSGSVQQLHATCWWERQHKEPHPVGWGGLVRTAALAAASPTFADLQMSFVMDHDLANTFYSFLSSSLREIILHYFFVSLLFLTMFRCCIQMPLDGFFWCDGIWEEDMWLLMWRCAENEFWIKAFPLLHGYLCESLHIPTPLVLHVKRICCFPVLSLLHAHTKQTNSPWDQQEAFY